LPLGHSLRLHHGAASWRRLRRRFGDAREKIWPAIHVPTSSNPSRDAGHAEETRLPANASSSDDTRFDTFEFLRARRVRDALTRRPDLYFVFLSTETFLEHERFIHIPWVETEQEKADIIHCMRRDASRANDGETFGLAVGSSPRPTSP